MEGSVADNDYTGLIILILVVIIAVVVPVVPIEDCTRFLGINVICHTSYVTVLQYILKQP
jgi:hypothetical protein